MEVHHCMNLNVPRFWSKLRKSSYHFPPYHELRGKEGNTWNKKKEWLKSDLRLSIYMLSMIKNMVAGSLISYLLNLLLGSASLIMFSKTSTRWHAHKSAEITQSPPTSHWYFRQNCSEKTYKNSNSVKWYILPNYLVFDLRMNYTRFN